MIFSVSSEVIAQVVCFVALIYVANFKKQIKNRIKAIHNGINRKGYSCINGKKTLNLREI